MTPAGEERRALRIVVGLGNPGPSYADNRHNAGFRCVECLADAHRLRFDELERGARLARGRIRGHRILLAKPLTYMNRSGDAVGPLVRWYKVPPGDLLVVYDDLDLPVGTIRLRPGGSAGGHKGMRSIISALGTEDFPRLRLGIGRPPAGVDPADYVLSDFHGDELPLIEEAYQRAVAAVDCWLRGGIDEAMDRFN